MLFYRNCLEFGYVVIEEIWGGVGSGGGVSWGGRCGGGMWGWGWGEGECFGVGGVGFRGVWVVVV